MELQVADRGTSSARAEEVRATGAGRVVSRPALVFALLMFDALAISGAFGFAYVMRFKTDWSIFYTH